MQSTSMSNQLEVIELTELVLASIVVFFIQLD